jgi:SAM-dependent methyltransferase
MPQHKKPEPYHWLAKYYDQVFTPEQSPYVKAHNQLLRHILPRVKSACDLACGTGITALEFAHRGIETFAVDLSPEMCRLTREKASRAGLPVNVTQQDMRSFLLPHPVDLITCESDALNHVPNKTDLRRVAKAVARALNSGGHFLFDVNNARGFKRYWKGNVCIEKPGLMLVMRNGHTPDSTRAWSDVEWFIQEEDGKHWLRHHERVEEVCWSRSEIWRELIEAGFEGIRAWDAKPFYRNNPLLTRGCHTIYLARKSR